MSLFVNPQNQKLLWDIIHKSDLINRVFLNSTNQRKEEWFRNIIQMFYNRQIEKQGNRNITMQELKDINRETLIFMNEKLREYVKPTPIPIYGSGPGAVPIAGSTVITMPSKQESYNEQFQQRQKEYEQMNEKKAPDVLNFSENIDDKPISNMEDLIQSHIKMREAELKQYSHAPPIPNPNVSNQLQNEVIPLIIDKKSNISLEIEPVELVNDEISEKSKKSVTWQIESSDSEEIISDENNNNSCRLDKLESIVLDLATKIETILMEIQSMKSNEKSI